MFGKISIEDDLYPVLLRKIPDPPEQLYYKGRLDSDIFNNCLAVVGSRVVSSYGIEVIKHIFSNLSRDITIVSGFMSGVDARSHKEALRIGLRTVAVMPCGIDRICPVSQRDLYEKILDSGIILSEYSGDLKPKSWTYLKRNRIVSGLSKATLVIESKLDSGSVVTARLSNSYGRKVFTIPGSIFKEASKGNIFLSNLFANNIDSSFYINKYFYQDKLKKKHNSYKKTSLF